MNMNLEKVSNAGNIFVNNHLRNCTKMVTFAPMIELVIYAILIVLGVLLERFTRHLK